MVMKLVQHQHTPDVPLLIWVESIKTCEFVHP